MSFIVSPSSKSFILLDDSELRSQSNIICEGTKDELTWEEGVW